MATKRLYESSILDAKIIDALEIRIEIARQKAEKIAFEWKGISDYNCEFCAKNIESSISSLLRILRGDEQ